MDELSLFNLDDDPAETTNLAKDHPEIVQRLQGLLEAARNDLGDHDRVGGGARFFDDGPQRPDVMPLARGRN